MLASLHTRDGSLLHTKVSPEFAARYGSHGLLRQLDQRDRVFFFFSSRRRHTRWNCDWSSDVCSSDLDAETHEDLRALARAEAVVEFGDGAGSEDFAELEEAARLLRNLHGQQHFARLSHRSEERRVGKECGSRWPPYHEKIEIHRVPHH